MFKNKLNFGTIPKEELNIPSESIQFQIKSENTHSTNIIKEEPRSDAMKLEEVFIKEEIDIKDEIDNSPISDVNTETISRESSEPELSTTLEPQTQKLLKCHYCGLRINRISYFEQHMNMHTKTRPFKCNKCNFQTAWKISLKKHMMIHAGNAVPLKYNILNSYKTQREGSLKGHTTTHDIEFKYDRCNSINDQKHSFSKPTINYANNLPFKCDKCSYKTSWKRYLQQHVITQHGEKPFECDICEFKTAWSGNVRLHRKIHTEGKFFMKCSKCNYRTTVKQNYEMHIPLHTE